MLLFDPSTHEHFQSVDGFIEHICASAPGLEEKLAMTQAWHKASVRMHVDDLMASVHSGDRGSGPLRKRCGDTVDHIVDIYLVHDVLNRRILERHGVDPETWLRCRNAEAATGALQ